MDQAVHLVRGMSGTWVGQRLTGGDQLAGERTFPQIL